MTLESIHFLMMVERGITARRMIELMDQNLVFLFLLGELRKLQLVTFGSGHWILTKRGYSYIKKLKKVKP